METERKPTDYVVVTDNECVDVDDFYLTDEDWVKERADDIDELRQLAENGALYVAYVVPALHYSIYKQMDAEQVFINGEKDIVMRCEFAVIGNEHEDIWEDDS